MIRYALAGTTFLVGDDESGGNRRTGGEDNHAENDRQVHGVGPGRSGMVAPLGDTSRNEVIDARVFRDDEVVFGNALLDIVTIRFRRGAREVCLLVFVEGGERSRLVAPRGLQGIGGFAGSGSFGARANGGNRGVERFGERKRANIAVIGDGAARTEFRGAAVIDDVAKTNDDGANL